jgi:uracil-DNA glycosylase
MMNLYYQYNVDICQLDKKKAQVITHQCSCDKVKEGKGLYKSIVEAYPYADVYNQRDTPSKEGSITLCGDKNNRYVLCMFSQKYPGNPKTGDSSEERLLWFKKCLDKISKIINLKSIAFPYKIGCGLAKGKWIDYEKMLIDFAENNPTINVYIVSNEPRYPSIIKDESSESQSNSTFGSDDLIFKIPKGWGAFFKDNRDILQKISDSLHKDISEGISVYPPLELVFNAFELTPLDKIKAIIIGQDCYHGASQAMGISFSVNKGIKVPPSLVNIYKELNSNGFKAPLAKADGDLTKWCKEGVLMINASLTVREGCPNSHEKIWRPFTEKLMDFLGKQLDKVVVIMWGNEAKKFSGYFDKKVKLLMAGHPSPLNSKGDFLGNNHFTATNDYLKKVGKEPIDWNLS